MKKMVKQSLSATALLMTTLVIGTLTTYAEPKENNEVYKKTYATTEDIFLDTIHPELNKIVLEKHGPHVQWGEIKITEIKRLVSPTKHTYQAKMIVKVFRADVDSTGWGQDEITINFDSHRQNKEVHDYSTKPNIELVEYRIVTPTPES